MSVPPRPWLRADPAHVYAPWRPALEAALQQLDALPLTQDFAVTELKAKHNSLRLEWVGADGQEAAVQGIALALEDATQGPWPELA